MRSKFCACCNALSGSGCHVSISTLVCTMRSRVPCMACYASIWSATSNRGVFWRCCARTKIYTKVRVDGQVFLQCDIVEMEGALLTPLQPCTYLGGFYERCCSHHAARKASILASHKRLCLLCVLGDVWHQLSELSGSLCHDWSGQSGRERIALRPERHWLHYLGLPDRLYAMCIADGYLGGSCAPQRCGCNECRSLEPGNGHYSAGDEFLDTFSLTYGPGSRRGGLLSGRHRPAERLFQSGAP